MLGEVLAPTPLAEVAQLEQTVPLPLQARQVLLQTLYAVDSEVEGEDALSLLPRLVLLAEPGVLEEAEAEAVEPV